jgi:hypothetical protein
MEKVFIALERGTSMVSTGAKKHGVSSSQVVLAGLLLLVLCTPLTLFESQITSSIQMQAIEPGLAPRTGSWSYFTNANRGEPPVEKPILALAGAIGYRIPAVKSTVGLSPNVRAKLPASHRKQYLIPMFYSSYT